MIGAGKLDVAQLKGRRMINLDSEEEEVLTVSCAGGSDFKTTMPIERRKASAAKVTVEIAGLAGGHSGVEIDKGRVNANILAGRILNAVSDHAEYDIISINGGDKGNAIPLNCKIELAVKNIESFCAALEEYVKLVKNELNDREPNLEITCICDGEGEHEVLEKDSKGKILYYLLASPDGIVDMSKQIDGLVETSLNLGILKTSENSIYIQYALRSNKSSALNFLQTKMIKFAEYLGCETEISGRYEPWEYNENSSLRDLYISTFSDKTGHNPEVCAIHAGLECAVFSGSIPGLDCIAIGPDMTGVHTVQEKLSISSTKKIYEILCDMLAKM